MRHDLQWDALSLIFSNISYRFTPPSYPHPSTPLFPTDRTWSFAELYLDCISNSSRANKSLKDKMSESTDFAVNFGKLCLLINVGRINTTLACA
jgi:Ino eighty subunit 1